MASKFRQDMPPEGGYRNFEWMRNFGKKGRSGYAWFGLFFGVTGAAWAVYFWEQSVKKQWKLEMNDGRLAMEPLLQAELQREYLKQLRKNRDYEAELMKDVPGWEVGKWNGKPVYNNPGNRFPVVHPEAYYAHTHPRDLYDRFYEHRNH